MKLYCDRCKEEITPDKDPPDGWHIETGEIICNNCCVVDLKNIVSQIVNSPIFR